MKSLYSVKTKFFALISMVMILSGCGESGDNPAPGGNEKYKRTILLYAVASNNLYRNLNEDKEEILEAASGMNLSGLSMMVYQVAPTGNPGLYEVEKNKSGECGFALVKEYSRELYSTDPDRILEVMEDVRKLRNSDNYGLILWSHGTGIDPSFSTHGISRSDAHAEVSGADGGDTYAETSVPELYAFGADKDSDKNPNYYDRTDIDELSEAIPDGMFDFIWFDACYMAGIETIYQLRNKCRYFVGYPTEVYEPGMPYDLTIPYMLRETPDLVGAARAFFNYYAENAASSLRVATVAVADMEKVEPVADYCRLAYSVLKDVSSRGLQKYSRSGFGPFYDFGQYTRIMAEGNPYLTDAGDFENLMKDFIIYKAATEKDFNFEPILQDDYSGVSCYLFKESDSSDKGKYYHTLDWYERVYPPID